MKKNKQKNFKIKIGGFTMIELLIVIVILGILSAIGLGSFTAAQVKSRDSKRKSSLNGITTALETYYNDHDGYPLDDDSGLGGETGLIAGCGAGGVDDCEYGEIWEDSNNTVYMVQLPDDPRGGSFHYVSDGTSYYLYARLENVHDGSVPEVNSVPGVYVSVNDKCGGDGCNYGVVSSNIVLGSSEED